jgi:hypothetical protein
MTPAKPGSWPKPPSTVGDKNEPDVIGPAAASGALREVLPSSPWEVKPALLDPPGWDRVWSQGLPHWPYVQAVDQVSCPEFRGVR